MGIKHGRKRIVTVDFVIKGENGAGMRLSQVVVELLALCCCGTNRIARADKLNERVCRQYEVQAYSKSQVVTL